MADAPSPNPPPPKRTFQAPKGTRDFYPEDLLRRRYIIDSWRRTALRHGFEEIDGPTFEDSQLYAVKSGEGILNEIFGAYSGKDPKDAEQVRAGGPPPFALRPEFTPTLARMYAARAKQLPQPTKWFCVSNFFRAERPQRGRLREFWQWNVDVIGSSEKASDKDEADYEMLKCCIELCINLGITSNLATIRLSDRNVLREFVKSAIYDPSDDRIDRAIRLIDGREKMHTAGLQVAADAIGFDFATFDRNIIAYTTSTKNGAPFTMWQHRDLRRQFGDDYCRPWSVDVENLASYYFLEPSRDKTWCDIDLGIARGLAYYTGTVFELIAEGERAVAGGGRYDKLIELFGGPPTPAVGFGMGDVVLTNLLDDRKLMPEGRDLLEACARPLPVRCDVFVIANEKDESQAKLIPTVAALRRGVESDKARQGECKPWSAERYATPPLHARRSYKTTKNIGKLLADATACHARFACIIESGETCTLKNLDSGEQTKDVPLGDVGNRVAYGGTGL